jgi:hypothetical protein
MTRDEFMHTPRLIDGKRATCKDCTFLTDEKYRDSKARLCSFKSMKVGFSFYIDDPAYEACKFFKEK